MHRNHVQVYDLVTSHSNSSRHKSVFHLLRHPRIPNCTPLTTLIRCAIAISVSTTTMPASAESVLYDSYDLALAKLRPTTPAYSVRYSKSVRYVESLATVFMLTTFNFQNDSIPRANSCRCIFKTG